MPFTKNGPWLQSKLLQDSQPIHEPSDGGLPNIEDSPAASRDCFSRIMGGLRAVPPLISSDPCVSSQPCEQRD